MLSTSFTLLSRLLAFGLVSTLFAATAAAQIPAGYYDSVDASSSAAMRSTLHQVIDDHQRYPYTSTGTDTWNILELAQQDPNNSGRIIDVYLNASYPKHGAGNTDYNREHTWPKSYGFPNDSGSNYPYTDCHVLFLSNDDYNSSRSNKPFRTCDASCTEEPTDATNGSGGGTGTYPGNSNWTEGAFTSGSWEAWIGKRGDVARAMLYMDIRYEGGVHGGSGASEPDLILTNSEFLIDASNTGNNLSVAYMGMLSVLLQWHLEDPVDDFERNGHEVIYGFQGNRNPFIDHPEWVDCLFLDACSPPSSAYCFGDGSGNTCPCSNHGAADAGCANSVFGSGSQLLFSGSMSVAAGDLQLDATASIPNAPGLFFQGQTKLNGGNGLPFGDGLRCVGGTIVRLQVRTASFLGDAHSTLTIPIAGGVSPGDTRRYQWWYRDSSGSPCGSGFNTSNAVEIQWVP